MTQHIQIFTHTSEDLRKLRWVDPSFDPTALNEDSIVFYFDGNEALEPHVALTKIHGKIADITLSDAGWASFRDGLLHFILEYLSSVHPSIEILNLYTRKLTKSSRLVYWKQSLNLPNLNISGPHECDVSATGESFLYSRMKFSIVI